ncbi:MAG: DNA topoisomerase [Lachnospiraceae bacterium]|nr:DNA topoisomerase [Lachnospiraceae bacterium]
MGKRIFIAEKPSVAKEFAKALNVRDQSSGKGYLEDGDTVVTWCVGHLVTMSYPEVYDPQYKRWSMNTLPFLPDHFLYELLPASEKQFKIVSSALKRQDVTDIYVCTDSGREGEYIYRLVEQMSGENVRRKHRRRVWIDSQTEEEILRGIREAKDLSEYDNLADSAYLRAKEDYLIGINFSRALTLKYGRTLERLLKKDHAVISVGRVMTCVLGMIVRREREIRSFVKTPYYRVVAQASMGATGRDAMRSKTSPDEIVRSGQIKNGSEDLYMQSSENEMLFEAEWRVSATSRYLGHPDLYKENGFKVRERAQELISNMSACSPDRNILNAGSSGHIMESSEKISGAGGSHSFSGAGGNVASGTAFDNGENRKKATAEVLSKSKKTEKKSAPLLYNLAELQNDCSKIFKISPDETLNHVQSLYEKKLVTYPRTDARVLSTAVAKEIGRNIGGLKSFEFVRPFAEHVLAGNAYKNIAKTKYVNDKLITDHYAIIPTGQGAGAYTRLPDIEKRIYELIARRFLSIFYPPAVYDKISLVLGIPGGSREPLIRRDGLLSGNRISGAKAEIGRSISEIRAESVGMENVHSESTKEGKSARSTVAETSDVGYLEEFAANFKILKEPGYLEVAYRPSKKKTVAENAVQAQNSSQNSGQTSDLDPDDGSGNSASQNSARDGQKCSPELFEQLNRLRKGSKVPIRDFFIRESETSPPTRYNSGSIILAMENAGQLIEDESLREQIKGSGIGTSATRAEILKKLVKIEFISLNQKTQILTPTLYGEMIYQVVDRSMRPMLNPDLTASWEKGLSYVAEGTLTSQEYMDKLEGFVTRRVNAVKTLNNESALAEDYNSISPFYRGKVTTGRTTAGRSSARTSTGRRTS